MIRVHHLNCVEIQPPMGGRGIGHCLLLETPGRLVLVDTGIGRLDTLHPAERIGQEMIEAVGFRFNDEWTAIQQIERMGLNPALVTDCIISHLDNDHVGGLADFPAATAHIGVEEYNNFISGNARYLKTPLLHVPTIITYSPSTETWFGFEARSIDVGLDIPLFLIPLFGHTNGHCGVAILHNDKWLFYVGDAYYLRDELESDDHPISELAQMRADNNEQRIETLRNIRKLVKEHPEIAVFSYHDFEEYDRFVREGT